MRLLLLATFTIAAQAQNWSIGGMTGINTWDTGFHDLQTPGWVAHWGGHPVGVIDLQWKSGYVEIGGDPHRPKEATSAFAGLRHDLVKRGRWSLYGQVSAGVFEAPSFLEYCGSYEYRNGDCGAGNLPPEYCPWLSLNAGAGVKVRLSKRFWLDLGRGEYIAVYGIGPRFRFLTGFRIGL